MKKIIANIIEDFSPIAILVIPIGVAVNIIAGQIAAFLKLPIFLDAIGTIFVSILCGANVGICTGIISTLISSIVNPTMFPFVFVSIALGYVTGKFADNGMFNNIFKIFISIIVISLVSILISTPIVVLLYGGITGGGNSLITGLVMTTGASIWTSVFSTEGLFTLLDRIISVYVCLQAIKCIPDRALINYKNGSLFITVKKEGV